MDYGIGISNKRLKKLKRYIYLISHQTINGVKFYNDLNLVLKTKKVRYFQLRLKKTSTPNLLKISKKIKKIVKKNHVKLIINDNPFIAKMINADGCHVGQKDISLVNARKILGKNKIIGVTCHNSKKFALEAKMVPIVEPEVLMDGEHNISKCFDVTTKVLIECYKELKLHKVNLKGTILKPNMILPGKKSKDRSNTAEIAKMTLKCLRENVPSEVPGIAFLSGGQTEIESTQNLNEINKINDTNFVMSFSYGRALQQSALKNWAKNIKDTTNTQKIFNHRSKMNGLSTSAKWSMNL